MTERDTTATGREKKEWTLMFYFASDNPLAPSIVSQLKAIKDAGFHDEAHVVARFDPHTDNTPAHIFEVNLVNKLRANGEPQIGFIKDNSYVRNLVTDKLWGQQTGDFGGRREKIRDRIRAALERGNGAGRRARAIPAGKFNPPEPGQEMEDEQPPKESLESFLNFCRNSYPARRYMLFILGHGLVVGNDLFLFDEHAPAVSPQAAVQPSPGATREQERGRQDNQGGRKDRPRHSLLLSDLGAALRDFRAGIGQDSEFSFVGFHSCSMSSLEVAYELQDTAKYMMASQGPAFVGSWPYRQILVRIFKDLVEFKDGRKPIDVKETLRTIFFYCLYNSFDFQLAGYSFDLTLCDLTRLGDIKEPFNNFTRALMEGLKYKDKDPVAEDLILLAHWDSQSYWLESCTDLRDFCLRLRARCERAKPGSAESARVLKNISDTAEALIKALRKGVKVDETTNDDDCFIVRSECAGPTFQYSHGMSVYFPWSEPLGTPFWEDEYEEYKMNKEPAPAAPAKSSWMHFLKLYFEQTKRQTRAAEDAALSTAAPREQSLEEQLLEEIAVQIFNEAGQLGRAGATDATGSPRKAGGSDPTGGDCDCPSVKNFPSTTRAVRRQEAAGTAVSKEDADEETRFEAGKVPVSSTFFERIMQSEPE